MFPAGLHRANLLLRFPTIIVNYFVTFSWFTATCCVMNADGIFVFICHGVSKNTAEALNDAFPFMLSFWVCVTASALW